MPMSRLAAGIRETSVPSTVTDPESAASKPARMRSAVVLPHPDGPSSATSSPGAISSDRPARARTAPKWRLRSVRATRAPAGGEGVERGGGGGGGGGGGADGATLRRLACRSVHGHSGSPMVWLKSCWATLNSATWDPPRLRAPRPPTITMTISRIQVTTSASSEAATDTGPLFCSNWTIHTGNVTYSARLAMVNSPSTSATVSTVADMIAVLMFGSTTRQSVLGQPAPSEFDASTIVFRSNDRSPASSERYA